MIQQNEIFATASIGITIFPLDGMDPVFLMRNADAAMYEAKKSGRNGYHFFTNALNEEIQNRGLLEKQLRQAVESNEFALHYQPQVDPYTGRIEGAEALLRWTTNDGDNISPGRFIPVAEDTGLIVPLGHWVLKEAISWINQWRQQGRGPRFVAVNVSPRQFREAGFAEGVLGLLSETNTPPDALEIEVTESLLIEDDSHENVAQVFDRLKAAGVRLSIDDFGTGYSSLSYLKKFPFDTLKIDASFIRQIAESKDDQALVEAISGMARSLGLKVVAEGVEDREQLEILMNMSCDYIQGYYFGHAMPAHSFAELINDAEPRQNIVSLTDR